MSTTTIELRLEHDEHGQCVDREACRAAGVHTRPAPLPGRMNAPDGRLFGWGPINHIHTIGEYEIVEYREDQSNHSASQPWAWDRHGRTLFHPYVNGRSMNSSFLTLDSALVAAVGYKREGLNSRAAMYFDRMTGAS